MTGFGERLRNARKDARLTLDQLAEKIGSSKAYVWQLENKDTASPSAEIMFGICAALGKEPSYFIQRVPPAADELVRRDILFRKFDSLTEGDRRKVLSIIEIMDRVEKDT